MSRDFTIKTYRNLLITFQQNGYTLLTLEQFFTQSPLPEKYIVLRHDVDEMPHNALNIAQVEYELGVKATYSFRIVKQSNQPEIIREIASLGHEIGYHYEDLVFAEGDFEKAITTFRANLAYFRNFYEVKTISMHGSSTSKYDNKDLWKHYDFKAEGLIGEPYLSVDYSDIFYLTDTGHAWDGYKIALRDKVEMNFPNVYRSTFEIMQAVENNEFPKKVLMLAHTLWTDNAFQWFFVSIREKMRNKLKIWSRSNRFIQKLYGGMVRAYWKIK